jgi:ATP-dependent Lon protease
VEEFKVMNSTKIDTELWLELKRMLYRKVKKMCPITDNDREIICKLEKMSHVDISIQQKIVRSNHSEKIKSIMYDKYRNIKSVDEDNWEYNKTIEWINRGLKIPTEVIELKSLYNTPLLMIQHIYANIDNSMYGQQRAKEQILEYMSTMWANQKNNKNNKNYPVTFIGSPGVGKTAFARLLANGLQLPFYQISLGGIRDSSHLEGHSATYVSSKPGEIYNAISSMGIKNGILFLDELDKVQNSEVIASLIHILDPTQNYEFKDNYMPEIPIDLSKLFIIISVNDEKVIDSVLKDRLYFINFSRYGIEEKVNIGLKYIVPRKLNDLDISHNDILVTEQSIRKIIAKSTIKEDGVRQLEKNISTILERINTLKYINSPEVITDVSTNVIPIIKPFIKLSYNIPNFKLPISLDDHIIDKLFYEHRDTIKNKISLWSNN